MKGGWRQRIRLGWKCKHHDVDFAVHLRTCLHWSLMQHSFELDNAVRRDTQVVIVVVVGAAVTAEADFRMMKC